MFIAIQEEKIIQSKISSHKKEQYGDMQYTVYSIQYTVYSIQYTVYSIQYTVYCIYFDDYGRGGGASRQTPYATEQ